MATPRYFGADYFGANYFDTEYFAAQSGGNIVGNMAASVGLAGPGAVSGAYWGQNYLGTNYWSSNYWFQGNAAGGTTFTGTFSASDAIVGLLSGVTDVFSAFAGSVGQVVIFDVEYGFTPNWTFTDTTAVVGAIAPTLDDHTASLSGLFSEDFTGTVATTLADALSNLDGTHVAPQNRTGSISAQLSDAQAVLTGINVASGAIGVLSTSLTDANSDFQGQSITSDTDGSIGVTLDDFAANWDGAFFDAGFRVATLSANTSVTSTWVGSFLPDQTSPAKAMQYRSRQTDYRYQPQVTDFRYE